MINLSIDFIPCELCGKRATEHHHVFGGANRKHSEQYKLVACLCAECHRTGENSVHRNANVSTDMKQRYQTLFELVHGHEKFMRTFGRNYL